MPFKGWPKTTITTDSGEEVSAIAPLIISASRSTDIPAFYGEWFRKRLDAGYVKWKNPWSGKPQYVSFANARLFVFWSKNPAPFIPFLEELDKRGLHYYFQVTVNDYEKERLEKNIPPLAERIETFKRLAGMIGSARVLWRFDPLIRTDALSVEELGDRIVMIGRAISGSTERCTVSFLERYPRVLSNLAKAGVRVREWDDESRDTALGMIARMGRELGIEIVSCATSGQAHGIMPGKCIDEGLIARLSGQDENLMKFLGVRGDGAADSDRLSLPGRRSLKDRGQRPLCNCIVSKDIGAYSTCGHGCVYCYANTSLQRALENSRSVDPDADSILRGGPRC